MSRVGRIVATALITAALVIAVEVGVTLAWAEPVTNLQSWLEQREAEEELLELEHEFRLPDGTAFDPAAVPGQADRLESKLRPGRALGRIKIPRINVKVAAVEGTGTEQLKRGPGHYPRTSLPGQPGTTAFAGHRTTYGAPFRFIDRLRDRDRIVVEMPYATFTYRFERQRIVDPTQTGVVRDVGYERLVLTSCDPPYSAAKRIVVLARLARIDPPAGSEEFPASGLDLAGIGLGPTIFASLALFPIAVLMWLTNGRRPRLRRPGAGSIRGR